LHAGKRKGERRGRSKGRGKKKTRGRGREFCFLGNVVRGRREVYIKLFFTGIRQKLPLNWGCKIKEVLLA